MASLRPGRWLTRPVTIGDAYTSPLRLEATCYGLRREVWRAVLINAEVEPDLGETLW